MYPLAPGAILSSIFNLRPGYAGSWVLGAELRWTPARVGREREGERESIISHDWAATLAQAARLCSLYPTLTEEVAGPCELDGRGFEE